MHSDPFADPLQFLSACHGRIRQRLFAFRLSAMRLRAGDAVARHEIESALLFFRTSGEGHAEDEEQLLFPILRVKLVEAGAHEVVALIDRLVEEHRGHEELFARLASAATDIDPTLGSGDGLSNPDDSRSGPILRAPRSSPRPSKRSRRISVGHCRSRTTGSSARSPPAWSRRAAGDRGQNAQQTGSGAQIAPSLRVAGQAGPCIYASRSLLPTVIACRIPPSPHRVL